MKKFFILYFLTLSYLSTLLAQDKSNLVFYKYVKEGSEHIKPKFDENSLIRDTLGNIIPFQIWQNDIKEGNGIIKTINDTLFVFTYFTQSEKVRVDSIRKDLIKQLEKNRKEPSSRIRSGKKFPNFRTRDINGAIINTKKLRGKILVLNFWFINCGPCRQEMPELNKIQEKFAADNDVIFVAIALDDISDLENFLNKTVFKYRIVDNGYFLTKQYNITSFPTNIVVDKTGKISYSSIGYFTNVASNIEKAILALK
jgi:thiol-disulfide isomerase/thioredoxin